MADENRRNILSRANRMLRQSKSLRKLSEQILKESTDLRKESNDIRSSVKALKPDKATGVRSRKKRP